MSTPQQIQQEIEGTRRALSANVDRLTEKVSPGRAVGRRVDRVKSQASSLKDRVMGSLPSTDHLKSVGDSAGSGMSSAVGGVGDALSSVGSSVGEAAAAAPQAITRQTQGNPLAVGLVAFGIGMVLSSLAPASEKERELAEQAQQKAMGPLQDAAREVAGELQEPAQHAVEQVKEAASQAVSDTTDQAKSAAEDVRAPLQQ